MNSEHSAFNPLDMHIIKEQKLSRSFFIWWQLHPLIILTAEKLHHFLQQLLLSIECVCFFFLIYCMLFFSAKLKFEKPTFWFPVLYIQQNENKYLKAEPYQFINNNGIKSAFVWVQSLEKEQHVGRNHSTGLLDLQTKIALFCYENKVTWVTIQGVNNFFFFLFKLPNFNNYTASEPNIQNMPMQKENSDQGLKVELSQQFQIALTK